MHTTISRRTLLALAGALALPKRAHAAEVPRSFDHVQLACSDLDKGIAFVESKTGVKAAPAPASGVTAIGAGAESRRVINSVAEDCR